MSQESSISAALGAFRRTVSVSALLSVACFPFDGGTHRLDGPYRLFATDVSSDMALCYDVGDGACIGRVGPTVFAAGWDARHLIVKRHPGNDRARVEYFILDRARDGRLAEPAASVSGPYTQQEFAAARQRFAIDPRLTFTLVLKDLE
jgi:hypothetical protein